MSKSKLPPQRNLRNITLFQEEDSTQINPHCTTISIADIVVPESQPRRYFAPEAMEFLIASIKKEGILHPLLVRPIGNENQYELIAGERRLRASQALGLTEVPVTIKQLTDTEAKLVALTENLQREDLNPVEETEGILTLLSLKLNLEHQETISLLMRLDHEMRGNVKSDLSSAHNVMGKNEIEEIFQPLGTTWQSFLKNRLPLLNLPNDLLEVLRQGQIAYTKAKAIAKIKDPKTRQTLLEEALKEELSLTQIKQRIKALEENTSPAITPQSKLAQIYKRIQKAQLWKDTQKWRKAETLLNKLEALIND